MKTGYGRQKKSFHLTVVSDIVTDVSTGIYDATGYQEAEILNKNIKDVLTVVFKINNSSLERMKHGQDVSCFLFTKDCEPKEVFLHAEHRAECSVVSIAETLGASLKDQMVFVEQLFLNNYMCAAIYSSDLVLLRANRCYMKYVDIACGDFAQYAGKSVKELGIYGPQVEGMLNEAVSTGKVISANEKVISTASGHVCVNYNVIPVVIGGELRYIFETSMDVTERVLDRQIKEAKDQASREQKEKLEAIIDNMSDLLIVVTPGGYYEVYNKAAKETFDPIYGHVEKLGDTKANVEYYDEDNNRVFLEDLPIVRVLQGEKFNRFRFKIKHETETVIEVNAVPIYDDKGNVIYGILCCRDITERVTSEERLLEQNRLLAAVVENMHDSLAVYNSDGRLMILNAKARQMFPQLDNKTTVYNFHDGVRCYSLDFVPIPYEQLPTIRVFKGEVIRDEKVVVKNHGQLSALEINGTPIYDNDKKLLSAVINHRDITDWMMMEKELRENELHLRMAAESAFIGTFTYSFKTKRGHWSPAFRSLMGFYEDEDGYESLLSKIHPDDLQLVLAALQKADDPVNGGFIDIEHRIILSDGAVRWIRLKGQVHFTENLVPILAAGIIIDITEKVDSAEKIKKITQELQNIVDNTDDLIISFDTENRVVMFNRAAESYYSAYYGETLERGKNIGEVKHQDLRSRIVAMCQRAIKHGKYQIELRAFTSDLVILFTVNPIYLHDEAVEVTIYGKDITD